MPSPLFFLKRSNKLLIDALSADVNAYSSLRLRQSLTLRICIPSCLFVWMYIVPWRNRHLDISVFSLAFFQSQGESEAFSASYNHSYLRLDWKSFKYRFTKETSFKNKSCCIPTIYSWPKYSPVYKFSWSSKIFSFGYTTVPRCRFRRLSATKHVPHTLENSSDAPKLQRAFGVTARARSEMSGEDGSVVLSSGIGPCESFRFSTCRWGTVAVEMYNNQLKMKNIDLAE